MATKYPLNFFQCAIAELGNKTIPPLTRQLAGNGRLSQQEGFGGLNSTPIPNGGIPPYREDLNGFMFLTSALLLWIQQGGIFRWSSAFDYEVGNEIVYNGVKYRCIQACKNITPTNREYWKNIDATVPIGAVIYFGNVVRIENKHPVFSGSTEPDASWVLCDGTNGTPNLVNRYLAGANNTILDVVGANSKVIPVNCLPAHAHTTKCSKAGEHKHSRGTMEITGRFGADDRMKYVLSGAFYSGPWSDTGSTGSDDGGIIEFKASRSWEGETSPNGEHDHTITVENTGAGEVFDVRPETVKLPAFMKISE